MEMRLRLPLLCLGLAFLVTPRPVSAGNDGHYCVGPDYIAYLFSSQSLPEPAQFLMAIFFDDRHGLSRPVEMELEPVDVRGLKCEGKRIDVAGREKHGLYRVKRDGIALIQTLPGTTVGPPSWNDIRTIGAEAEPRTETLLKGKRRTIDLRVAVTEEARPDAVTRTIWTALVEKGKSGNVLGERTLYHGSFEEPIR